MIENSDFSIGLKNHCFCDVKSYFLNFLKIEKPKKKPTPISQLKIFKNPPPKKKANFEKKIPVLFCMMKTLKQKK